MSHLQDIDIFINENLNQDVAKLALRFSGKVAFDLQFALDQIKARRKAKLKLPAFVEAGCYYKLRALEQCTSEIVAQYKARQFCGELLLDLTGGLGVDDWAFARSFSRVISLDSNPELNALARANFQKLAVKNIDRVDIQAESYISQSMEKVDLVYIDADRRVGVERSFRFEDATPNILELKDELFRISDQILIKASPLVDLSYAITHLKQVKLVEVIAYKNEVKEVLFLLEKEFEGVQEIRATHLKSVEVLEQYHPNVLRQPPDHTFKEKGAFFYEPNVALIKSDLAKDYLADVGIHLIHQDSVYGVSDELIEDFQGRVFSIVELLPYKPKELVAYFKANQIAKANIGKRVFANSVDEIRKRLKLKEGGEDYLFFTTNSSGSSICYHCRKVF